MDQPSKELIAYSAEVVKDWGIKKEDLTQEKMLEVMREALKRIDRTIDKYQDSPEMQKELAQSIYNSISEK